MIKTKKYTILFFLAIVITLLTTSCSTSRYPYKKNQRKRKCNCPKWSNNQTVNSIWLVKNE